MSDPRGHPSRNELLVLIAILVGGLAILATAYGIDADPRGHGSHTQLGWAPCGYLMRTGDPCPTCGMTTSFAFFARLDVSAAVRAQPFGALLFVIVAALTVGAFAHLVAWRSFSHYWRYLPNRWLLVAIFTALFLAAWRWKMHAMSAAP